MGRGRLSSIQLLPEPCAPIVAWASAALNKNDRTQTDIYKEFVDRLEALQAEFRGELEFDIPSFKSFNRHSLRLAEVTARMNDVRQIVSSLSKSYDPEDSDQLTIIASEAVKSLVMEIYASRGEKGLDPKGAMALANALRAASQAQSVSSARRQKVEAEFREKATEAVEKVAKAKGISDEGAQSILDQILGVAK
ncbi:DUF3486 family protein [Martelella mediterranea]|uniref:Uncharacterized protein DUF3486 n=1 Tax=Martelella mediterranea TaxID=293089 RepID=A0A4R3NR81_9HYPH|nr:DUF3486 family protein [Martelella mediterranea]TCT35386.1 uncharacterized protein DUF3486 [Martelella mediterranea]